MKKKFEISIVIIMALILLSFITCTQNLSEETKINIIYDTTPPYMQNLGITVDNSNDIYSVHNTITVTIDATDDLRGINLVTCALESPTERNYGGGTHEVINLFLSFNSTLKKWQGDAVFSSENPENGEWIINNINLYDRAGNRRTYDRNDAASTTHYYDRQSLTPTIWKFIKLNVVNQSPFFLEGITVTPASISSTGQTITVSVDAANDGDSIDSISVELRSPRFISAQVKGQVKSIDLNYNITTFEYDASTDFNIYNESGEWYVDQIKISNATGTKVRTYIRTSTLTSNYGYQVGNVLTPKYADSAIALKTFTVTETNSDTAYPVLTGASCTYSSPNANITITATDDIAGIPIDNNVIVTLESPTGLPVNDINVDLSRTAGSATNGTWTGLANLSSGASGTWKIKSIQIEDSANNKRLYYIDDMSSLYYSYNDSTNEITNPTVTTVGIVSFIK